MTLAEYLEEGGIREEKLVIVYHVAPEKLSKEYRAIFALITSDNDNVREPAALAFPDLYLAEQKLGHKFLNGDFTFDAE